MVKVSTTATATHLKGNNGYPLLYGLLPRFNLLHNTFYLSITDYQATLVRCACSVCFPSIRKVTVISTSNGFDWCGRNRLSYNNFVYIGTITYYLHDCSYETRMGKSEMHNLYKRATYFDQGHVITF